MVKQAITETDIQTKTETKQKQTLLKVKQVCEIFQVSKPTVYDWLKQGKIQSVKIQSRRYFHHLDVERLIQESKVIISNVQP